MAASSETGDSPLHTTLPAETKSDDDDDCVDVDGEVMMIIIDDKNNKNETSFVANKVLLCFIIMFNTQSVMGRNF